MINALIAAVLVGIACGVVGTFVVIKKIVFISGGISHSAFGGIGLGYLLGVDPILTAIPFSIAAALTIGAVSKKVRVSEDSAIGMLWVLGMALGILFVSLSPGYAPDLFSFLFGSILTVPTSDIWIMLALDALIVTIVMLFYKEFKALSFDEEYSAVSGVPTKTLYLLLLSLVALTVVMLVKVVGIILVIALLTIPAATVRNFTAKLRTLIFISIIVAVLTTVTGLLISYQFDLPSGATIVLTLMTLFGVSLGVKKIITFSSR